MARALGVDISVLEKGMDFFAEHSSVFVALEVQYRSKALHDQTAVLWLPLSVARLTTPE